MTPALFTSSSVPSHGMTACPQADMSTRPHADMSACLAAAMWARSIRYALRFSPCLANSRLIASSPSACVDVSVSRASCRICFHAIGSR
jgi:hypothetical protein